MTLPYSRVVNVTLTRNDNFPSRRGFGTQLITTTESLAGKVDANNRTKLYASMQEVADDWGSTTEPYKAASTAFSRNPRPTQIKIGHIADNAATMTKEDMQAQLDLIAAADNDWYFLTCTKELRDKDCTDGYLIWTESKNKLCLLGSNDDKTEDKTDTTCIAAKNKGNFERSGIFYHTKSEEYPEVSLAAYMQTRNFDKKKSAYTCKFKGLPGVTPIDIGSAAVSAVTGFTPDNGQSVSVGHMANCYVDIGGQNTTLEGSTLKANVFLDEIHATDWIIFRTEEEALGLYKNNARIPFTDQGMQQLASSPRTIMQQGVRAEIVAQDLDDKGDYSPAYEIEVPSVFDVPESQRKARIAPVISCRFRYSGAVHYTTINYNMSF